MSETGVLIAAFGGPRSLDEVGPFIETMTGREPSPEVVERSQKKYAAIGGGSPLPEIAGRIAGALERELADRGHEMPVRLGMRYAEPRIEATVQQMADDGVSQLVSVSLSPFESRITTEAYRQAVAEAADAAGCTVSEARGYHTHRGVVGSHSQALVGALRELGARKPFIVMSAHSLPCEEMAADDTYTRQLRETSDAVAVAAGLESGAEDVSLEGLPASFGSLAGATPWLVAYQSRGYRECAWLEPTLEGVMDAAASAGHDAVVVSPVGFLTDHMETRYDLDIVAATHANDAGLAFARATVPNDDPRAIGALAEAVMNVLPE